MKNLTLFFLFFILSSTTAYSQWERTNGPEGNSIRTLTEIDGKIFAGTYKDGIYASTDAGLTWFPQNNGIEYRDVRSIVSNSDGILAATLTGIFKSTDMGQTWQLKSGIGARGLAVKDNFAFAGANNGVYRSTDYGETWTQTSIFQGFFYCVTVSGNTILAGSGSNFHRSTDNGVTWERVTGYLAKPNFSMFSKGDTVIIGRSNEILRSYDNGLTFEPIDLNISYPIFNVYSITSLGSNLYMGNSYDGVYKSTDHGSTWFAVNEGMGPKDIRSLVVIGKELLAGSYYSGMYKSSGNVSNWSKANSGLTAASTIDEIYSDGEFVYAGTRDGLYASDDHGNTWTKYNGTNDTINYGTVSGICIKDGKLYASARYQFKSSIFKWENNTWVNIHGNLPDVTFIFGMAASGDNLLAGTSDGVYYSTNDGQTWNLTNLDHSIDDITSAGNGIVYANATIDGIYKSNNNGISWSPNFLLSDLIDVSADGNYAYSTSFGDRLWFSTNGGSSWLAVNFGDATFGVEYLENGIVLVSTDLVNNQIFISNNYGFNFTQYSDGLNPNSVAEGFAADDKYMFCGMDYNGVWRRLKPGVTNTEPEVNIPDKYYLAQNYPNPFNPSTTIKYSIPKLSNVKIIIYDIIGREVSVLVDEIKNPGEYSVIFNATNYSSGVYYYKIDAGEFSDIKKMLLLK